MRPRTSSPEAVLALVGSLALAGCARRDAAQVPAETPKPPFDHGDLALLSQPGDAEAPHRDLERIPPLRPDGATSVPVAWGTEIRNRCPVPASFVLGPEDAEIGADAPVHTLAPGEGVSTHLADDEWVLLITAPGEASVRTRAPGGWVIFQGDERCDRATAIQR